jgi:osmoprotectant transport system substrate-binding protein
VLVALTACTAQETPGYQVNPLFDQSITVASFDFAESRLLAELYSQSIEAAGFKVTRAFDIGPRELVSPALSQGLVELVPEYAGAALQFLSLGAEAPTADVDRTHAALLRVLTTEPMTALGPAAAQDANAFVVSRTTADRLGLRRISDLATAPRPLTFGGPPECTTRPLCLAGLQRVYGLSFAETVRLDVGGPVTRQALTGGVVDVALLFTTDPAIDGRQLVELTDDRQLQPAENVTPLVRREVLTQFGEGLITRINAVSARLTTDELRHLNAALNADGATIAGVASAWLRQEVLR